MIREHGVDPRVSVIGKRLGKIKNIIAVVSGKGGVGKSLISTISALILSKNGYKTGLLDLDFHGPSCHIILGEEDLYPIEEKGIIPPETNGIKFMSIVFYARDEPIPLRGHEISNAIIELLAITRWGDLDFLVIDMPPGMGDQTLDVIRFFRDRKFLVVTTPSILAIQTARRLVKFLKQLDIDILGILENMRIKDNDNVNALSSEMNIKYLGYLPFKPEIESYIGYPNKILESEIGTQLAKILARVFSR